MLTHTSAKYALLLDSGDVGIDNISSEEFPINLLSKKAKLMVKHLPILQ
jgi:hypothetical protein